MVGEKNSSKLAFDLTLTVACVCLLKHTHILIILEKHLDVSLINKN